MDRMTVEEVMRERAELMGWEFSRGLTTKEAERMSWLNSEARRLCPTVTQEMEAALEALRARLENRQARHKKPNAELSGQGGAYDA